MTPPGNSKSIDSELTANKTPRRALLRLRHFVWIDGFVSRILPDKNSCGTANKNDIMHVTIAHASVTGGTSPRDPWNFGKMHKPCLRHQKKDLTKNRPRLSPALGTLNAHPGYRHPCPDSSASNPCMQSIVFCRCESLMLAPKYAPAFSIILVSIID